MKSQINDTASDRFKQDERRLVMVSTVTRKQEEESRWPQAIAFALGLGLMVLTAHLYSVACVSDGSKAFGLGAVAVVTFALSLTAWAFGASMNKD